jgi:hypothetical protein
MSTITRTLLVAIATAFLLATGALAEPASQAPQAQQTPATQTAVGTVPAPIQRVECVVQGTPVEFPDDLYIRNTGNVKLEKNTKIDWEAVGTGRKGRYTLPTDLNPGAGTFASGVVAGGLGAGHVCTCKIVESQIAPGMSRTRVPIKPIYRFSCQVQGTPVEFPDDLYIMNTGTTIVAKGKVLHRSIPNTTRQGDHSLTEDLAPGKGLMLPSVLPGGVTAGVQCGVTVK